MDLDDLLDEFDPQESNKSSHGSAIMGQPHHAQQQQVIYNDIVQPAAQERPFTFNAPQGQEAGIEKNRMVASGNDMDDDWDFDSMGGQSAAASGGTMKQEQRQQHQPQTNLFNRGPKSSGTRDDFDQFLDDCGVSQAIGSVYEAADSVRLNQQPTVVYSNATSNGATGMGSAALNQARATVGGKCFPLFIGGSSLQEGQTCASFAPHSCCALRCSACDKRVIRYADNVKWGPQVDYIFVRNFNTLPEKLREGVESAAGYSCYACQCQHISVNVEKRVDEYSHLRWHCRGH